MVQKAGHADQLGVGRDPLRDPAQYGCYVRLGGSLVARDREAVGTGPGKPAFYLLEDGRALVSDTGAGVGEEYE